MMLIGKNIIRSTHIGIKPEKNFFIKPLLIAYQGKVKEVITNNKCKSIYLHLIFKQGNIRYPS